jgi:hypothetical protein
VSRLSKRMHPRTSKVKGQATQAGLNKEASRVSADMGLGPLRAMPQLLNFACEQP